MEGRTILHYELLEKLGEGGMGAVWKAEDTQLRRTVALKFLTAAAGGDAEIQARLVREAQASAALDHPNICHVYGIHQTDDETFIAMAFVDGPSLAEKIKQRPLPLDEALDIVIQMAEGLKEAHEKGIVHRDVKPDNVMLTSKGQVKIMDFGLALQSGRSKLTKANTRLGTLSYMAPEQFEGAQVDGRADLWSLGCTLYEMLAQETPFESEYEQAVMYSILNEEPRPLTALRGGLPRKIDDLVSKLLSKDLSHRYQDADDCLVDLRALLVNPPQGGGPVLPTVCVLPFRNRSRQEDDEYFADGVTEDVITTLGRIEGVRVVPRSSAFHFKGLQPLPSELARAVAATHMVEGSVRRSGERLRITVELISTSDGEQLWTERYDRIPEDIFDVQEEISIAIANALEAKLVSPTVSSGGGLRTAHFEAYRLYLQGRHASLQFSGGSLSQAISCFERALAVEPGYAPAYAGLAQAYCSLGSHGHIRPSDVLDRARRSAREALRLDSSLAEAHVAAGYIEHWCDWNFECAEVSYRQAIQLLPDDPGPRIWLGQLLVDTGRARAGVELLRSAVLLDPLSGVANRILAYGLLYAGDLDESIAHSKRAVAMNSSDMRARWYLSRALTMSDRTEEARRIAVEMEADRTDPITIANVSMVLSATGDREGALKAIARLLAVRSSFYASPTAIAFAYSQLPDLDSTFHWFDVALTERDGLLTTLRQPCRDEAFRQDPRHLSLLQRVGLPT